MRVTFTRCAGLDVHKKSVSVTLQTDSPGSSLHEETRTFGTTTAELLRMRDWLEEEKITHAAIESTGVFWKPVFNILEGALEVWVVNAQQFRNLPGRKTDVKDSVWLCDLLRHGLLKPSYIPSLPTRELRDLTRYRSRLIGNRAAEVNRIQKVLETANVKLASIATDVLGASGRAMIEAIIAGETDPHRLTALAKGRLKAKRLELVEALHGYITSHHRFMLKQHLAHIDHLALQISGVEARIEENLRPFSDLLVWFDEVPGVGLRTAQAVLAEIGTDMSRFPNAAALASWAAICPGHNQSGGKHRAAKTRKGSPWLRHALIEAAWAAVRTKDTYFSAQFARLKSRRGARKAIVAVAHSILVVLYHLIRDRVPYRELGADYFQRHNRAALTQKHMRALRQLGYEVEIKEHLDAA